MHFDYKTSIFFIWYLYDEGLEEHIKNNGLYDNLLALILNRLEDFSSKMDSDVLFFQIDTLEDITKQLKFDQEEIAVWEINTLRFSWI